MNRSACRVMMGVAGLAVLGMTARLAGAQTDTVKEKPPLYRYVSYRTFPRAHWAGIDNDNATGNQNLAPALADDENQVHAFGVAQIPFGSCAEIELVRRRLMRINKNATIAWSMSSQSTRHGLGHNASLGSDV